MKKILFASDIDNTLIHSYKHRQEGELCIELLKGSEQGFMNSRVFDSLSKLPENVEFIPITTRSIEQFERINFPEGCYGRAVTTNGAILLEKGVSNSEWRDSVKGYADRVMPHLLELKAELDKCEGLNVCRTVDDMYLYISVTEPSEARGFYERYADDEYVDVELSGRKIYFLPHEINKGAALRRLKSDSDFDIVIAAGDSTIDVSMLNEADIAITTKELSPLVKAPKVFYPENSGADIAEFTLDTVTRISEEL